MSTIITHRQIPGYHKYEMELAGRPLTLEVGKLAELANAAVMVGYGDTRVLVCATASARPRDGIDFFPLSVDFEEKMYSVGRIPGSFNRREGRPGEKGILTSRVIDRPMKEGERCDLLDRLAADPAFGMTRAELDAVMDPALYTGRCAQQVERFLSECAPLLADAQSADGAISL